jgi:N-formylglutamate deformylase
MNKIYQFFKGDSPIIAAAIHDGHELHPEVAAIMQLSDVERLREEDPFTGGWTQIVENRLIGTHSRFEVDLNRPRERAVYIQPEDAWGLHVWKETPSRQVIDTSLAYYDGFYSEVHQVFSNLERQFGKFVVFDLHTYNHRREERDGAVADPELNPEVNLGTGTMDRDRWRPIVDGFIRDLRAFDFIGRQLDVRENIKFRGGQFARWTHENFPESACVLSIEFKKFFMDEWTGVPDTAQLKAIRNSIASTIPGVLASLKQI